VTARREQLSFCVLASQWRKCIADWSGESCEWLVGITEAECSMISCGRAGGAGGEGADGKVGKVRRRLSWRYSGPEVVAHRRCNGLRRWRRRNGAAEPAGVPSSAMRSAKDREGGSGLAGAAKERTALVARKRAIDGKAAGMPICSSCGPGPASRRSMGEKNYHGAPPVEDCGHW